MSTDVSKLNGRLVSCSCGFCRKSFTLSVGERNNRLSTSVSGHVYCSRSCGAKDRNRRGKAQKEAARPLVIRGEYE